MFTLLKMTSSISDGLIYLTKKEILKSKHQGKSYTATKMRVSGLNSSQNFGQRENLAGQYFGQ